MTTSPTCPNCGAALPADAPEQLCPACLFSAAEPTQAPTVASGDRMPSAPTPEELAPDFPGLEILELIGRGGMGAVYKARQKNLDRLVALKILPGGAGDDPHFAERFQREAQALARLNHPNIVSVFDFGRAGSVFYFLMEYVDGTNLRQMIRTGKMMPEEALAVVPKICDALQFAHEEGVVHRDVKPENILIDKRGRVKIADFGLAKLLRREQADPALTMTGMTLGTPRYMAPEQLDKPETVDHRADIYSLGVVIYEMLTGEVPMGRFAPPSEKVQVDVRLDEIVLHALERDADRRYQHVSQVREDVEMVTSKPQVAPVVAPTRRTAANQPPVEDAPGFFRRLAAEPISGKAAMVVALTAIAAHKLQWQSLIVPGNQLLSPANSLVISCKVSVLMLVLAIGTTLFTLVPSLTVLARKITRGLAGVFVIAALWYQVSFLSTLGKWEPGQIGKTLRMTQSYAEFGLYATIVLTALALLLFVLRFLDEKGAVAPESKPQTAARTATARFLRSLLWLAVVIGTVMFIWFDARSSFRRPEDGGTVTTVFIGAVQPWLEFSNQSARWHTNRAPDFTTVSGLAGIGVIIALLALSSFRPPKPAKPVPSTPQMLARIKARSLLIACLAGLAACLWPVAQVERGFGLATMAQDSGKVFDAPSKVRVGDVVFGTPMDKAGVRAGDEIVSFGGRKVLIQDFDHVWMQTPVGANFEITVLRDGKELLLRFNRPPDPVSVYYLVFWQFVCGGAFLAIGVLVFASRWLPGLAPWRGIVSAAFGIAILVFVVGYAPTYPGRELWRELHFLAKNETLDFWHKVLTCGAAFALLALGVRDFARDLSQREKSAATATGPEPRLSKCALWGVIWAGVGIPAGVVLALAIHDTPKGVTLGGILHLPVLLWAAVAFSAPVGATILGGVAVGQIKHSKGTQYGLPMAACALLAYPLPLVGALTFYLTNLVVFTIAFNLRTPPVPVPGAAPLREPFAVIDFVVLDSLAALAVMFFAGRAAWRKLAGR